MTITRVVPDLYTDDPHTPHDFYLQVLGFNVAMELDFIVTYASPTNPLAQVSVLSSDPSGLRPAYSVGVDDVDECHRRAQEQGCDIVYPITDEPWGVRRFFVRDPTGAIVNVVSHR